MEADEVQSNAWEQATGFYRPDGFVAERFGYQEGIPLYTFDQATDYSPQPHTIAGQHYFDFFVANQNRHKYGQWDDGKRKRDADIKPGWKTYDQYLSRDNIRRHLRGKDIYGCWGNLWTNWFAIDLDYHGGDLSLFLDILPILDEFTSFFSNVRWFYILNRNGISGIHLVGLLPERRLLEEIRQEVQKVLGFLEDENINNLFKYKPDDLADDQFHPVANLEIYPATNHNFRLPYAADRITITDEWLNLPGQVDLKPNLVKFMDYVEDKTRQAVPMADVIEYIEANIRRKPEKKKASSQGTRKQCGGGMGKIQPLKGRHLNFITGVVLGTEPMPADTIGCWATPSLRQLILVDGLSAAEAVDKLMEYYLLIPDPTFSDRLSSGRLQELRRTDTITANKIAEGNLYQPRPDESTKSFAGVKTRCQQIDFVFADPSTWHVLGRRKGCHVDISEVDFSLTFEDKLAVKEPGVVVLKCDVPSVYQVAHRIKALVTKYPGQENWLLSSWLVCVLICPSTGLCPVNMGFAARRQRSF